MRNLAKWLIGIGIGALFIYLSVRQWPLGRILEGGVHFKDFTIYSNNWSISVWYILLYFLTLVSMHVFRTWRWQPLLAPVRRIGFWKLNRYCAVGFMLVFILPLRLGELVRPYLLASDKENRVPMSTALASIVLERTMDGLMIGLLLTALLLFSHFRGDPETLQTLKFGGYLALGIFSGIIVVLLGLFVFKERAARFVYGLVSHVSTHAAEKVEGMVHRFLKGFSMLPNPWYLGLFLLLSGGYWLSNGIGLYILARGFDIPVPLSGAFAMMSTVVIGMLIPNSPANVGSFWYFLVLPLPLYGISVSQPKVVVYSLAVWTLQVIQLSLFGGYFLVTSKVRFTQGLPDLSEISEPEEA